MEVIQSLRKIEANSDRYKVRGTINAINTSLTDEESGLVIGQCKALIESLCKSVLRENKVEIEAGISIGKLAKKAVTSLGIAKAGKQDQKTREAFIKLVNSFVSQLENAASAVGTLRNEYCPLAHGRSHEEPQLHMVYARLVAAQTDSLVAFMLELIEQRKNFVEEVVFSQNQDFNEYLYDQFGQLEIYGDLYQAPEVLFNINPEIYRRGLEEFRDGALDD